MFFKIIKIKYCSIFIAIHIYMKYGICTLLFGDFTYLIGACISFYAHKQFIDKYKLNIKLIVMVDNKNYEQKKILELFFDEIIKIEMDTININLVEKRNIVYEKYSPWVKYSINKWKIFNMTNYDKILFIDIDVLPIKKEFYNIFNNKVPAIYGKFKNKNKTYKLNRSLFSNKKSFKCEDYNTEIHLKVWLNATILLIEPNSKLYDEYMDFIKISEGKLGYKTTFNVDETTLTYFLIFYKKMDVYEINKKYVGNWSIYNKNTTSMDFATVVKPWVKIPFMQWSDENIWHVIAKYVMPKSIELNAVYIKYMLKQLFLYYESYKLNKKKDIYYNMIAMKNDKLFIYLQKIFNIIENKTIDTLNKDEIKKIFSIAKIIHSKMNNYTKINYNNLKKIL
jgi:hypothetical protein